MVRASQNCFAPGIILGMMHITFTPMKVAFCLLAGLDAHSLVIAQSAARLAFPQAALTTLNTFAEALEREPAAGELLVLANPDEASVAKAVGAMDADGLRRWAIIVLGAAPSAPGVEVVSPQDRVEH